MTLSDLAANLSATMPINIVIISACVILIADLFIPVKRKSLNALLAAIGLLVAMVFAILQVNDGSTAFNGMIVVDGFAGFLTLLILGSGLVGIALAHDYLRMIEIERGEYYVLLLFSVSGMLLMAVAADLIVVFLALELLSFPLYVLAGFARPRMESEEAAIKYFLLGAFASGFVVYGIALVFGATGTTALNGIVASLQGGTVNLTLLAIGAALILVGLGFKVAAVPFHMWTPDVYQGAPSSVTAFMAVGAKAGGFAALVRIFFVAFTALAVDFTSILWVLAALTMILGNLIAISQTNIKRLLAYSSIAQAGYILMALVPYGQEEVADAAISAALFYLFAYAVTNFAAWAVVMILEKAEGRGLALNDYAGLGRKYPVLAAVMTVAMLSLTGVPPTIGFVGKFYLFSVTIQGGFYGLALIGVLTSLVSAYYYLRVVVIMYMQDGEPEVRPARWIYLTAGAAALATLLFGIFSAPLFAWASRAIIQL